MLLKMGVGALGEEKRRAGSAEQDAGMNARKYHDTAEAVEGATGACIPLSALTY